MGIKLTPFPVDAGGFIRGKKFVAHVRKKVWVTKNKHPRPGFPHEAHGENVYVRVELYFQKGANFDESADPVSGT